MTKKKEESADDQDRMKRTEEFVSMQRCKLGDDELLKYGAELADAKNEIDNLTDAKATMTKEFAGKIKGFESRISTLTANIRSKSECRHVKCQREYDYKTGIVTEFREDTGQEVGHREMTMEERQAKLELE